ncbi:unnamed protein product [Trypanosoma congolense IL3000]|uniref:WGS project CAEQ00000000 data, annotated contig 1180 n=1 Tax=Trypanosoma congolense (strain IL3000) TaxID=1068625 RepID=F9W4G9_TRYCI|nr:unnamed protein product [Trypanosoma congolense IL3000]
MPQPRRSLVLITSSVLWVEEGNALCVGERAGLGIIVKLHINSNRGVYYWKRGLLRITTTAEVGEASEKHPSRTSRHLAEAYGICSLVCADSPGDGGYLDMVPEYCSRPLGGSQAPALLPVQQDWRRYEARGYQRSRQHKWHCGSDGVVRLPLCTLDVLYFKCSDFSCFLARMSSKDLAT